MQRCARLWIWPCPAPGDTKLIGGAQLHPLRPPPRPRPPSAHHRPYPTSPRHRCPHIPTAHTHHPHHCPHHTHTHTHNHNHNHNHNHTHTHHTHTPQVDTYLEMMAQPPWDTRYLQRAGHPFHILHYTYGMDYTLQVGGRAPGPLGRPGPYPWALGLWALAAHCCSRTADRPGLVAVIRRSCLGGCPAPASTVPLSLATPHHTTSLTSHTAAHLQGAFTPGKYGEWRWDKRTYSNRPPPRHLGDPPKGMTNELVRHLINAINEATANIPCWDEYVETGKVGAGGAQLLDAAAAGALPPGAAARPACRSTRLPPLTWATIAVPAFAQVVTDCEEVRKGTFKNNTEIIKS
jgi:hypothetical protein